MMRTQNIRLEESVSVDCRKEREKEGLTNLWLRGEVFNFLFKRKNKQQKITSHVARQRRP